MEENDYGKVFHCDNNATIQGGINLKVPYTQTISIEKMKAILKFKKKK